MPFLQHTYQDKIMEAEQINALNNQLQDLALRSAELRRYL